MVLFKRCGSRSAPSDQSFSLFRRVQIRKTWQKQLFGERSIRTSSCAPPQANKSPQLH
ncbi:hypothetical protein ANCCAN_16211 [Ancylostoma caninum]|uniref:Uncharacterized protein n=1 Tax=Ancylostoma caninum TaxID=29170 RepID=A0A368G0J9_ANCCA|nr:hypothetical protein ANCCAN_16211 [Ancylostoma caninum]